MAKLLYFGRLSDLLGKGEETLDIPTSIETSSALRDWLDTKYEAEGQLTHASVRLAINNQIVNDPHPVSNSDEIAFMPPVGGG